MKPQETKNAFIQLRAEGRSYRAIAGELGICKSTCSAWDAEMNDAIAERKQEMLQELYTAYAMTKEARIKKLGDTLGRIDTALAGADLESMPPERLLDYKLKYTAALKEEYTGTSRPYHISGQQAPQEIIIALEDLLCRVRAGEVTTEQANRESTVISSLLKAYETVEVKAKIEALEAIVGNR